MKKEVVILPGWYSPPDLSKRPSVRVRTERKPAKRAARKARASKPQTERVHAGQKHDHTAYMREWRKQRRKEKPEMVAQEERAQYELRRNRDLEKWRAKNRERVQRWREKQKSVLS